MEHSSFDPKAVKENVKGPDQTGSAGREGNTFAPPAYGIESLDSAQVGAIQMKTGSLTLPNRTGLPDALKSGVESLSGLSLDDVRVHYNSSKPAQLQALAYTQGADIHVAPGQERHLPHEAWHVVQQKQGRVKATMQMKGTAINDSPLLEREASVMGAKALQLPAKLQTSRRDGNREADGTPEQGTANVKRCPHKPEHAAGPKTAQLYVSQRHHDGMWESSLINELYYTREDAEKAEKQFFKEKRNIQKLSDMDKIKRVPTFFTYMHTDPDNAIPINNQGPHVVGDIGLKERIYNISSFKELSKVYGDQVPDFDTLWGIAEGEMEGDKKKPSSWNSVEEGKTDGERKKERFQQDYQHHKNMWELAKKEKNTTMMKYFLYEGMNLHPYGTYGWNQSSIHKKGEEWKQNMKTKGERRDLSFDELLDKGYDKYFTQKEPVRNFLDLRKKLWSDETKKKSKKRKRLNSDTSSSESDTEKPPKKKQKTIRKKTKITTEKLNNLLPSPRTVGRRRFGKRKRRT